MRVAVFFRLSSDERLKAEKDIDFTVGRLPKCFVFLGPLYHDHLAVGPIFALYQLVQHLK